MTTEDTEPSAATYGQQRRSKWLEGLQRSAEGMAAGAMDGHRADHDIVTASKAGLFGQLTAEEMAAAVAASQTRIGDGTSAGRKLERLGGTRWEDHGAGAVGPIPGGAYVRPVENERPAPGTESPLLRHMRGREQ